MAAPRKVVLHSVGGSRSKLAALVRAWIADGVGYVGVVGKDAAAIEDDIDSICIGDGSDPYYMLTAAHGSDEALEDAIFLAEQISTVSGSVAVVEV
ncbi:hypothetical protein [Arenimonas aestuarii]